jgi:serine/threonine protein kinase
MSSLNNKNVPEGILTIVDPDNPPKLNKVKKRVLMLSPTVNAGLEPESKISDFEKEREIGKGGFGLVLKVLHKKTQKVYCIKVIEKQGIMEQKLVDQMNREIEIMYILNNPHCLRLKNHFEDDTNFYLVMPLASKGQLYRVLKKFRKFDERTAAQILRETISALQYLHSFNPPIIHRDIKPENLLLNEGGRVLLADYGWSNFNMEGDVRKTFCGTPEYIAPEMLMKKGHDTRVDIWSIGILMFELLAGYSPFVAKTNQELYQNIKRLKIQWPKDMPPLAKNLISKILKINPLERPTFDEILNHQWFKQTKMIKPLLENKMKSLKDLLAFHMLNGCDDETLEKINKLLKLSGKDADNENAKSIVENAHEKEEVIKKKNIVQDIKKIQNENIVNKNRSQTSSHYANRFLKNMGQNASLFLENQEIRKENEIYKSKLKAIESELKNLKNENVKLKDENTSDLQEKLKEKEAEIEKLKIMDKARIAVLAELEQRNKINMDLNSQIQILENECLEKDKTIEGSQSKLRELNKQIEIKDIAIDDMIKKNQSLDQEKEQLFINYQKKIEELQLQVLDSASSAMDSTSGLCKVIDILNSNVDEFKNIFKKKIDNFEDIFDKFKSEYSKRDESFNFLLNNKAKEFNEFLNSFVGGLKGDVQNVFNNINTPTSNINDEKINWLNKQVNEMTEYKNKIIEYENKYKDLSGKKETEDKKYNEIKKNIEELRKKLEEQNQKFEKIKNAKEENEKKYNDMEKFMKDNFKKDIVDSYNQQCK